MRTKLFLESTQNQRCFNVEFYRWINVDKSTLNQRGYHVDWRRDVISTYIDVESTLSVCWAPLLLYLSPEFLFISLPNLFIPPWLRNFLSFWCSDVTQQVASRIFYSCFPLSKIRPQVLTITPPSRGKLLVSSSSVFLNSTTLTRKGRLSWICKIMEL